MDVDRLRSILEHIRSGEIEIDQALERLRSLPFADLGYAQLDLHRALRTGYPEVVFCDFKTVEQVEAIFTRLAQDHSRVLGTRASTEQAAAVQNRFPHARYDPVSRLLWLQDPTFVKIDDKAPYILVACAGTADLPVAEEAAQTAEFYGSRVVRAYDVGVAGIHRLLSKLSLIQEAEAVISVAGMEGALTSVIAGLAACPVIGVPTSVGYGASFDGVAALLAMLNSCAPGVAALLAMLNSCAPGVAVVNIDNGFGAGLFAHTIVDRAQHSIQKALSARAEIQE